MKQCKVRAKCIPIRFQKSVLLKITFILDSSFLFKLLLFLDSQKECPKPDWIGDGTCDKVNPKFNMDTCQFDRGDCCEKMLIGNGICEDENNFASCGNFDGGDCLT